VLLCLVVASCDGRAVVPVDSSAARVGVAAPRAGVRDLPLVEVPAARSGGRMLALVLSGDGDWAEVVAGFSRILADSGIPVIGLESRSYLSSGGSPAKTASDMERVLRAYRTKWNRDEILIAGYSRGADLVPFVVNRLPDDLKQRVRLVALLSPSTTANFHFHWIDLVRSTHRRSDVPLAPEIQRMGDVRTLCVYGRAETESLCPTVPGGRMDVVTREGGHATSDYRLLAGLVISRLAGGSGR
jgi:type IV secretory pathway VirJ component